MVAFRLLSPLFALPLVVMTTDVNDLVLTFSGSPKRTFLNENNIRLRSADYVLLIGGVIFFIGAVVTRLTLGWGSFVA